MGGYRGVFPHFEREKGGDIVKLPIDMTTVVGSLMLGAWIAQVTYETCKKRIYSLIWTLVGLAAFILTFTEVR
jgi:hypothetical protein